MISWALLALLLATVVALWRTMNRALNLDESVPVPERFRRMYLWVGLFELEVALILVVFAFQQGEPWNAVTTAPALVLVGLGFVLVGLRRPRRFFDVLEGSSRP